MICFLPLPKKPCFLFSPASMSATCEFCFLSPRLRKYVKVKEPITIPPGKLLKNHFRVFPFFFLGPSLYRSLPYHLFLPFPLSSTKRVASDRRSNSFHILIFLSPLIQSSLPERTSGPPNSIHLFKMEVSRVLRESPSWYRLAPSALTALHPVFLPPRPSHVKIFDPPPREPPE